MTVMGVVRGSTAGWAVVDVETTGLSPQVHRVVSVACRTVEPDGRVSGEWSSLVDPGCDPGPVHIHGITRERLRGAPSFELVSDRLCEMLDGRVLVAHNAKFDHGFLQSETRRHQRGLPVLHRLCTLTASRRMGLPVDNFRLQTLAQYWGVRQTRWHDALDDVRVLSEIFGHTRAHAARLGVDLPVLACDDAAKASSPITVDRAPRVPCLYVNPAAWQPGTPLVQGMKIVITGDTRRPRREWYDELVRVGLNPMNNVSSQTRVVMSDNPVWESVKARAARELGIPIITEGQLASLLDDVRPGETPEDVAARRTQEKATARSAVATRPPSSGRASGPWAGRVVLVLGGRHDEAAEVRERVAGLGARVLVSLGGTATHVVALAGAETDRRWPKVVERGLVVVGPDLAAPGPDAAQDADTQDLSTVLVRGQVIDLPRADSVTVHVSWEPSSSGPVVDVVALALGEDDRVVNDDDFVFYNQPETDGIVLSLNGDAEQGIELDLDVLQPHVQRVRIAAAIDGAGTFGDLGAISITVDLGEQRWATAVLDAGSVETVLVLGEVYRRDGGWRLRTVGRGYETSLRQLATEHGVVVDG